MHKRAGDTLIEVTLAVGIFSMVAISAAAVMSGGTSSAQTALETTLAREEIDTQAEALRFIHSAYLADENSGNEPYTELWQKITENAITSENDTNSLGEKVMKEFTEAPTSCQNVSENNSLNKYGFVINTKSLGKTNLENDTNQEQFVDNVYINSGKINSGNSSDKFKNAVTYPHLVYDGDTFLRAEGIYVIAVKDPGTTNLVREDGTVAPNQSGYYDFYIRTCWYGTSSETPSTISTVIRLYDPPEAVSRATPRVKIIYSTNSNGEATVDGKTSQSVSASKSITLTPPTVERNGYSFDYWYIDDENNKLPENGELNLLERGKIICNGNCVYEAPESLSVGVSIIITAKWTANEYIIKYDGNGANGFMNDQIAPFGKSVKLASNEYTPAKGYIFKEWNTKKDGTGTSYPDEQFVSNLSNPGTKITLYAQWQFEGVFMQSFTKDDCKNKASSANYTVFDLRDMNSYTVRYADGNCWMTEDLRIFTTIGQETGIILSTNSNFKKPESWKLNVAKSPSYTEAQANKNGYYNFCAATANNSNGCTKSVRFNEYKDGDICPENWRLPTYSEFSKVYKNEAIFQSNGNYDEWWSSTDSGKASDDGSMLNCTLAYDESGYNFGKYTTTCKRGNKWWGYFRDNMQRIRCIHK